MVTSVPYELAMASVLGFGTTSSSLLGAAIGLYVPLSKRPLACLLAFAAGALISALAIELAYEGALSLHQQGFDARSAWVFISTGFAAGAVIYYSASLALEKTLMLGMFLGGIPEAAASASMLTKAGYRPAAIFGLWSTVLVAGVVAAAAGKAFIGSSDALLAIFAQAVAGGAVLALVAHAMIPVALEEGGSLVVLPTVGGFLFALYLALAESFV
jgi:hypothetical protein